MNSAAPQTVCETVPEQGTGTPLKSACTRCMKLEIELEEERVERRSLCAELREVNAENRRLARENRDLSARCATLEERQVKDHAEIQNFEKILNFQCNEVPSKT